jgi:predicted site-specific integrase-resolvase
VQAFRKAFSITEAAAACGVSYHTLWRAICRGDLRPLKGFGRLMISESELNRFLSKTMEHTPRRRKAVPK